VTQKPRGRKAGKSVAAPAGRDGATRRAGDSEELSWLRQRLGALEAVVEENLALGKRIASLEAENERLQQAAALPASDEPQEPGLFAESATRQAPLARGTDAGPAGAMSEVAAALAEARFEQIINAQSKRQRSSPDALVVGPLAYCSGSGPSLAHVEIRDILYAMPEDYAVSLLAIAPDGAPDPQLSRSPLHESLNIIQTASPDAQALAQLLDVLSPAVIINTGPLGETVDVFRNMPAPQWSSVVLNLLHGEVDAIDVVELTGLLCRAGTALVSGERERDSLKRLGFGGEVVVYRRGVAIQQMPFAGINGGLGILALLDEASTTSISLTADIARRLAEDGITLATFDAGAAHAGLDDFDIIRCERIAEVHDAIADCSAILLPPATSGVPQALQLAMAMGKICLLSQDTYSGAGLEDFPGIRYPVDADEAARVIAAFCKDRSAHADLAERTAAFARKAFRRGAGQTVLKEALQKRVTARAPEKS